MKFGSIDWVFECGAHAISGPLEGLVDATRDAFCFLRWVGRVFLLVDKSDGEAVRT